MANCQDFIITLKNETDGEIKVTKFEYEDGGKFKTENIFGADGHQKVEKGQEVPFPKRNLQGIGDEYTQFRVTYQNRLGGTKWSDDHCQTTETFKAHDNGEKTVTLTHDPH